MLNRILRRKKAVPAITARVPAGTRVYAIGDIHGRLDLLDRLHRMILDDVAKAPIERPVLIYLGDYVDRGLESRQVIDRLIGPPLAGFETVFLKGNHEELMLEFLETGESGPGWMICGGDATSYSYGVGIDSSLSAEDRDAALRDKLDAALPDDHRAFLETLSIFHREGDYIFVHAGLRPGIDLDQQVADDLLWIRMPFLSSEEDHGGVVVHGHSIENEPQIRNNRIGIDTGAFATGVLTCLVLDDDTRRFLHT